MNGRELAMLCMFGCLLMSALFVVSGVKARRRKTDELDRRRLDLLEKALQHPILDDAARTELLQALVGAYGKSNPTQAPAAAAAAKHHDWWPTIWFGAGWFLFVIGGCMLAAEGLDFTRGVDVETMLPMTIVGFAMLTLPAALRELQARRERTSPMGR